MKKGEGKRSRMRQNCRRSVKECLLSPPVVLPSLPHLFHSPPKTECREQAIVRWTLEEFLVIWVQIFESKIVSNSWGGETQAIGVDRQTEI